MEISTESEDFSDTIFWFLHENSNFSSSSSEWTSEAHVDDDEIGDSVNSDDDEKAAFWHGQEQQLLATLCRTTSTESRVRQATEEAVKELPPCACGAAAEGVVCRSCSRKEISNRLFCAGFDCSIRNSKWSKSSNVPSGEHSYLEVVHEEKKRVIVEPYLRAEFEMARAGDHYDRLLSLLPEVFVGRPDRLRNVVKILSGAAKRCMKENGMHVPPWRRLKYMQSKWFSSSPTFETRESMASHPPQEAFSGDRTSRKLRASMLTSALLGNFTGPHRRSVAVL